MAAPGQRFIIPDPWIPTLDKLYSKVAPDSPYPSVCDPVSTEGLGMMGPVQSGQIPELDESTFSIYGLPEPRYALVRAGGVEQAEFVVCPTSTQLTNPTDETRPAWRGRDDVRHWHDFHCPIPDTDAGDNSASCYSSRFRRIIVFHAQGENVIPTIRYRDVDADAVDAWTVPDDPITLVHVPASGNHNAAMLELPDGRIMLIIRTYGLGSLDLDYDIYHSDDGGITFSLASRYIISRFLNGGDEPTHEDNAQFRVARSGEWIRLVWADNTTPGLMHTWLSRDRGITWEQLPSTVTFAESSDTDDKTVFDLVGVDDYGTFTMVGVSTGFSGTRALWYFASQRDDWTTGAAQYVDYPYAIRQIILGAGPMWLYNWVFWSDRAGGTDQCGWDTRRAPRGRYNDAQNVTGYGWTGLSNSMGLRSDGVEWEPCRVVASWIGAGWFFYGARKSAASTSEQSLPAGWYGEGWTEASIGEYGPSHPLEDLGTLWDIFWCAAEKKPTDGPGSAWTHTSSGTGTNSITPDSLVCNTLASGDTDYFERAGPTDGTWYTTGGTWRFKVTTEGTLSTTTANNHAFRIRMANAAGTSKREVAIRVAGSSVVVFDDVANSTLLTIDLDGGLRAFTEIRFTMNGSGSWVLAIDSGPSTDSFDNLQIPGIGQVPIWAFYQSGGGISGLASVTASGYTSAVRFGGFAQSVTSDRKSKWREVSWTVDGRTLNTLADLPTNELSFISDVADALFGAPTSPTPSSVYWGIDVAWAGVGGAEGNAWIGRIDFGHPPENMWQTSPRVAFKVPWANAFFDDQGFRLVFDAGDPADGTDRRRWWHDAMGFFGCNIAELNVYYTDDPSMVAANNSTEVVLFWVYDTDSVSSPWACAEAYENTIYLTATQDPFPWVAGELVGKIAHNATKGVVLGRITRNPALNVIIFDEVDEFGASVDEEDEISLWSPDAVVSLNPLNARGRYFIIEANFTNVSSYVPPNDPGPIIGTVVPGWAVTIDVPILWQHDDDEQPNNTEFRTRAGIGWAFPEGPSGRKYTGRLTGDIERFREKFAGLLRQVAFTSRPVVFVEDTGRPIETCRLVTVTSGANMDNKAWLRTPEGIGYNAGDLAIVMVEEK